MAHAASFDQSEQLFREIGRMIAGPLEGLRHEQDFSAVLEFVALKMPAKERTVHLVNFAISEQDLAGTRNIAMAKTFADLLQHFLQNLSHFEQLVQIRF